LRYVYTHFSKYLIKVYSQGRFNSNYIAGVKVSLQHRTYTRIPLTLDVQIQFKGVNLGHAFIRNIDPFGAFIELSKSELVINDFVKIYFTNTDENQACVEQKGMVMHCSKEGVGILFAIDSVEFRTMLKQEMADAGATAMGIRLWELTHKV
jgi:hypothetical protein